VDTHARNAVRGDDAARGRSHKYQKKTKLEENIPSLRRDSVYQEEVR